MTNSENRIRYIDIDPSMTQLENLIQIADKLTYTGFYVNQDVKNGKYDEWCIDERTHRDKNGIFVVKPIAEDEKFFWYICPFCTKIHIESKRYLFIDRPIINANCKYRNRLILKIRIIAKASPLAQESIDEIPAAVLEEWEFMQAYNSTQDVIDLERR